MSYRSVCARNRPPAGLQAQLNSIQLNLYHSIVESVSGLHSLNPAAWQPLVKDVWFGLGHLPRTAGVTGVDVSKYFCRCWFFKRSSHDEWSCLIYERSNLFPAKCRPLLCIFWSVDWIRTGCPPCLSKHFWTRKKISPPDVEPVLTKRVCFIWCAPVAGPSRASFRKIWAANFLNITLFPIQHRKVAFWTRVFVVACLHIGTLRIHTWFSQISRKFLSRSRLFAVTKVGPCCFPLFLRVLRAILLRISHAFAELFVCWRLSAVWQRVSLSCFAGQRLTWQPPAFVFLEQPVSTRRKTNSQVWLQMLWAQYVWRKLSISRRERWLNGLYCYIIYIQRKATITCPSSSGLPRSFECAHQ